MGGEISFVHGGSRQVGLRGGARDDAELEFVDLPDHSRLGQHRREDVKSLVVHERRDNGADSTGGRDGQRSWISSINSAFSSGRGRSRIEPVEEAIAESVDLHARPAISLKEPY